MFKSAFPDSSFAVTVTEEFKVKIFGDETEYAGGSGADSDVERVPVVFIIAVCCV